MTSFDPDALGLPCEELILREVSRNLKATLSFHENDVNWYSKSLECLRRTAIWPNLSHTHRVSACNVLCGMLDFISVSVSSPVVLELVENYTQTLVDLYLYLADVAKTKSLRQILMTASNLLQCCQSQNSETKCVQHTAEKFLDATIRSEDVMKAKFAFNGLSLLLSRHLITASRLVATSKDLLASKLELEVNIKSEDDTAKKAFNILIQWMSLTEVAPVASRFIALFASLLHIECSGETEHTDFSLPVWAVPLLKSVEREEISVENLQVYFFPELIRRDVGSFNVFFKVLRDETQSGIGSVLDKGTEEISVSVSQDTKRRVLIATLHVANQYGLIKIHNKTKNRGPGDTIANREEHDIKCAVVFTDDIAQLLALADSGMRLAGFVMLVSSRYATEPLTLTTIRLLKKYLPYAFTDTDASYRASLKSMMKNLIFRIRAVLASLARQNKGVSMKVSFSTQCSTNNVADPGRNLSCEEEMHIDFLKWLIGFCGNELTPCASYQRHITALQALDVVVRSGVDKDVPTSALSRQAHDDVSWPVNIKIFNSLIQRNLFDLLFDPFHEVRQIAFDLTLIFSRCLNLDQLHQLISRAESLTKTTSRANDTDGLAWSYAIGAHVSMRGGKLKRIFSAAELCYGPEKLVELLRHATEAAEKDLGLAVNDSPLYGRFIAMRYFFEHGNDLVLQTEFASFQRLIDAIIDCTERVWDAVQHILCTDAPEGYLPEDLADERTVDTKELGSYAWRAVREAALLMQAVLTTLTITNSSGGEPALNQAQVESIGMLCFKQLAELRHRGAFSTVAQTFAFVCERCVSSGHEQLQLLLQSWYQQILSLVNSRGSTITRRSAGIPALLVAVLSADTKNQTFLDEAVGDLLVIAKPATRHGNDMSFSPQVHALNCLKALFITPKPANALERHLVPVLKLATESLTSDIWTIRNCGLMLTKVLFERLLGQHEAKTSHSTLTTQSSQKLWERYPGLSQLLQMMLTGRHRVSTNAGAHEDKPEVEVNGHSSEILFPALDILRKISPKDDRSILSAVEEALSHSHWQIRDMAARTYAHLQPDFGSAMKLISDRSGTSNEAHGKMLLMKHVALAQLSLARSQSRRNSTLDGQLEALFKEILVNDTCLSVTTSNILNEIAIFLIQMYDERFRRRYEKLVELVMRNSTTLMERMDPTRPSWLNCLPSRNKASNASLFNIMMNVCSNENISPHDLVSCWKCYCFEDNELFQYVLQVMCESFGSSSTASQAINRAIAEALVIIITDFTFDELAQNAAFRWLPVLLDRLDSDTHQDTPLAVREYLARLDIQSQIFSVENPVSFENGLRLWGFALAAKASKASPYSAALTAEINAWRRVVAASQDEYINFDTRKAAIDSLRAFLHRKSLDLEMPKDLLIDLSMLLYSGLIDDDDEIRENTVEATSVAIMRNKGGTNKVIAPFACDLLCNYLVTHHGNSAHLLEEGVVRMIGGKPRMKHRKPVTDILKESLDRKGTLFEEEKQNLYVDPVVEARRWCQVLKRMVIHKQSREAVDELATWVMEGLDALTAQAEEEDDGEVGWCSQPDVFAVGTRVLCGSEVLLKWRSESKVVRVRASEMRLRLGKLASVGERSRIHPQWLQLIQGVLDKAVVLRVSRVAQVLRNVTRGIM